MLQPVLATLLTFFWLFCSWSGLKVSESSNHHRSLSECHFDFRISKTKCTHHDGSIWISGVPEKESMLSRVDASSSLSKPLRSSRGSISEANSVKIGRLRPSQKAETVGTSTTSMQPQMKKRGSPWVASCFDRTCASWQDSKKRRIEAHGGGMIQVENGTFYWYGESQKMVDKSRGYGYSLGVNCYSSINLGGPWVYEGMVLTQNSIWVKELSDSDRPYIIERPKVLYNERTRRYVMWFHLDAADTGGMHHRRLNHRHRYWFRHAGVAMSTSPTGPFRFVHALQPDTLPSLDLQVFEESNGAAYLIRSVNNEYVGMSRLSDDYLTTTGRIISTVRPCLEGMAVFRNPGDSTLYALMSHLSGWEPNPLVLLRAHKTGGNGERGERCAVDCWLEDNIQWVDLGNPSHHAKSFNQQPTFVMTLRDRHQKPYVMLMSDNWLYAGYRGLPDAGYIWLPLEFRNDATIGIRRMKNWTLDAPFEHH